jgi:lambda repressor-like predicted transcriptional regulator
MKSGRERIETTISLDSARLRAALAARGLSAAALTEIAKISPNTATSAMNGRPITTQSARKIAEAIDRTPVVAGLAELLAS